MSSIKKIIYSSIKEFKKMFFSLFVLSTISIISILVAPYLTSKIYDSNKFGIKEFKILSLILIFSYIINLIVIYMKGKFTYIYKVKETEKTYNKIFNLKYDNYLNYSPTYLVEMTNQSINAICKSIIDVFSSLFTNIILIGVILFWCLHINLIIFSILLVIIPLNIFSFRILNKKLSNESSKLQRICSKNFGSILNIVSQVDYIKQNSNTKDILNLIRPNILNVEKANYSVNKLANFASQTIIIINKLLSNLMIVYIGFLLSKHLMPLNQVVIIIMLQTIFFNTLSNINNINLNFRDVDGALNFLDNELDKNLEDSFVSQPLGKIKKIKIKIDNISIKNIKLLKNINIECHSGDVIGIIGESGSGKSTLGKYLLKFREIDGISFNEIDLKKISKEIIRERVSYYSQNIPIFSKSIFENILFGKEYQREEVENILKNKIFFNMFKEKFSLDTKILENGNNLSGGEKQRIALMRAFLEVNDVVILDEITSSIDVVTSKIIIEEIIKRNKDSIIILITHDLKLLKYMTKIYKINNKNISIV